MNKCSIIDNNWFFNTRPQWVINKMKKKQIIVGTNNCTIHECQFIYYIAIPTLSKGKRKHS